jgi:hypothetical protein
LNKSAEENKNRRNPWGLQNETQILNIALLGVARKRAYETQILNIADQRWEKRE